MPTPVPGAFIYPLFSHGLKSVHRTLFAPVCAPAALSNPVSSSANNKGHPKGWPFFTHRETREDEGFDCLFACGEKYGCRQFLNWRPQQPTGLLHGNWFKSSSCSANRKSRPAGRFLTSLSVGEDEGFDCLFATGEKYGCRQFLNWRPQQPAGLLHGNWFESPSCSANRKSHPNGWLFLLAEDEGFEPPRTESESGVLPLH